MIYKNVEFSNGRCDVLISNWLDKEIPVTFRTLEIPTHVKSSDGIENDFMLSVRFNSLGCTFDYKWVILPRYRRIRNSVFYYPLRNK